jgi:hypothetical protein
MTSIFLLDNDEESSTKVNIDELYEKRQKRELKQLSIFKKILNRIHKKIQHTAKNKYTRDTHLWYVIPEYLVGEPIYDKGDCIAYIVSQLETNGFQVKYIHPNTVFISWHKSIPSYVRNEIKIKTGIILDEYGNYVERLQPEEEDKSLNPNRHEPKEEKQQGYNSVKDYKPSGNLLYAEDLMRKIEKKINP